MSHLVIYDIDGIDQFERFVVIDEAVALVERLRNEGNSSARIYRLDEIQFEVKAYYRIEVPRTSGLAAPTPSEAEYEVKLATVEPTELVPATTLEAPPEPDPIVASGETVADFDDLAVSSSLGGARRGLFGR